MTIFVKIILPNNDVKKKHKNKTAKRKGKRHIVSAENREQGRLEILSRRFERESII